MWGIITHVTGRYPRDTPGLDMLTIGIYTLDKSKFYGSPAGYGYQHLNENDYHYHLPGHAGLLRTVINKRASVTILYKCTVNHTIQNCYDPHNSQMSLI